MKTAITAFTAILLVATTMSSAYAEVPGWVKNNAGWWAEGVISESEFLTGIAFLISDGIITVPATTVSSETTDTVPSWVKNNAGWWADGTISDGEFVNGIQHLIQFGLLSVSTNSEPEMISDAPKNTDSKLAVLEANLNSALKSPKPTKD